MPLTFRAHPAHNSTRPPFPLIKLSDVVTEVASPNLDRALKATVRTTSVLRVAFALETLGEWEKAVKVYRLASEKQVRDIISRYIHFVRILLTVDSHFPYVITHRCA